MDKKLLQEEYEQASQILKEAQAKYQEIKKKLNCKDFEEIIKKYKGKAFCFNNESYYLVLTSTQFEDSIYFSGTGIHFQFTYDDFKNFQIECGANISLHTLERSEEITLEEYEKIVIQTTNIVKDEIFDLQ